MSTAASKPASQQQWKCLVQAAMAEADAPATAKRITCAEDAIIERARQLLRMGERGPELLELMKALCSLGDLRRRKLPALSFAAHKVRFPGGVT